MNLKKLIELIAQAWWIVWIALVWFGFALGILIPEARYFIGELIRRRRVKRGIN